MGEIANDIKELLNAWLLAHIKDPVAKDAYIQRVKEQKKGIKITDFLEGVADVYLTQHPKKNEQYKSMGVGKTALLIDAMLEEVFTWGLVVNADENRKFARDYIKSLMEKIRGLSN